MNSLLQTCCVNLDLGACRQVPSSFLLHRLSNTASKVSMIKSTSSSVEDNGGLSVRILANPGTVSPFLPMSSPLLLQAMNNLRYPFSGSGNSSTLDPLRAQCPWLIRKYEFLRHADAHSKGSNRALNCFPNLSRACHQDLPSPKFQDSSTRLPRNGFPPNVLICLKWLVASFSLKDSYNSADTAVAESGE